MKNKELRNEIAKINFDNKIKKAIKLAIWKKEFDKWAEKLGEKNGYTEYVISDTRL